MCESAASFVDEVLKGGKPAIQTGFSNLDTALDGGLHSELYVIGARPGLGKTSFALQMAGNIAKKGVDVLYFTFCESVTQLVTKTLSRLVSLDLEKEQIIVDQIWGKGAISEEILKKYEEIGTNLFYFTGTPDMGVKEIRKVIGIHRKMREKTPVVIIDFLQALANDVNKNVSELMRLCRELNTPIIAISAIGRGTYNAAISHASFTEGIERSTDVLIGLQYKGKEKIEDNQKNWKNGQMIQAKMLKNRHGACKDTFYKFYPDIHFFQEEN